MSDLGWKAASLIYRAGTAGRRRLYSTGVVQAQRALAPVISVGNISAGGTGKTPLVEWIAREAALLGRKVCVLSRGYGRPNEAQRVLVSDGRQLLATVEQAGDEPFMLAESLLGPAAVLCDRDRVAGAEFAARELGCDLIILDDGFQHLRLARDLDIVTVDATRPFAGLMREGIGALRRADAIVLTRADQADGVEALREKLSRASNGAPIFSAGLAVSGTRAVIGDQPADGMTKDQPAGAFCGIGNPRSFFSLLSENGHHIVYRKALRDHASYTQEILDTIVAEAMNAGATVLFTTAKDGVKLRDLKAKLPVLALETYLNLDRPGDLINLLKTKITKAN